MENETIKQENEAREAEVEVVGIRFRDAGKIYYFASEGHTLKAGGCAIVETARGQEFGFVEFGNRMVPQSEVVAPLRPVVRAANEQDMKKYEQNREKEKEAFRVCLEKIEKHKIDMKLVAAEYTFDNSKLLFYFTADGRVDFRELVKDLASIFRTRIELRQIGIRDEAKMLGGLGSCGRPFCCSSFLFDFAQVSIKMAKEQNLSLNSAKISGVCGRLMCCLRYEHETYEEEIRHTPPVDSVVKTAEGTGRVVETSPLAGLLKVSIEEKNGARTVVVHRDDVKVISVPAKKKNQKLAYVGETESDGEA